MSAVPEQSGALEYHGRDLESMSLAENYYRWMLGEFTPFIGKEILEVGAGSGSLTDRLLTFNPTRIMSFEPSENMFPLLQKRFSGHAVVETRGTYLAESAPELREQFDTAIYVNVLEHVPDDAAEMRLVFDALKPGGHVLIFVPALPWLFGSADELFGHFRRYTKESLAKAFAGLDIEVLRCRYFDIMGILPWWMTFVVLRRKLLSHGMVQVYDRLVVPWASRLERLTDEWPAGKNLLFVARKRG